LLSRANITDAQASIGWLVGIWPNRGWDNVAPLLVAFAVLFPVGAGPVRWMATLQLATSRGRPGHACPARGGSA